MIKKLEAENKEFKEKFWKMAAENRGLIASPRSRKTCRLSRTPQTLVRKLDFNKPMRVQSDLWSCQFGYGNGEEEGIDVD